MKYDIERFLSAQEHTYETALSEIRRGRKRSHWIWYIFPQLKGLGRSEMSMYYGIDGLGEAKAYLEHKVLRERLTEISNALLALPSDDPSEVMGYPDDVKLQSSMTLFAYAAPEMEVFQQVLDKYYQGRRDRRTQKLLMR